MKKKNSFLIVGNGYVANCISKEKKINFFMSSHKKLFKKKIKNIDVLIHAVGMNRTCSNSNYKKALIIKKKSTNQIIQYAIENNIKKLIYLSSIHVYSSKSIKIVNESQKVRDFDSYGKLHLFTEKMLKRRSDKNLKVVVLRVSNLFGLRKYNKKSNSKLTALDNIIYQLIYNKKFIVENNIIERNFSPINYFIKVLYTLKFCNNFRVINLGYKNYTLLEVAKYIKKKIKKLIGHNSKIIILNYCKKKTKRLFFNSKFIKLSSKINYFNKEVNNSINILKSSIQ